MSNLPLEQRTPDDLGHYLDNHVVMALRAADILSSDRQTAEDLVRDRLVALSDTFQSPEELWTEERRRVRERLLNMLKEA